MHLTRLALADFRSYASADVALQPGVTIFSGPNGEGKTNLVEAVGYVATLSSHRVAQDAPLIRQGAERAIIRANVHGAVSDALVEIELNPGRANRIRLNHAPLARPRDVLGVLRTVLFAPEDLALVKGDPGERRRFLDDLLVAMAPRYAGVRADYDRVLRQRTALLKSAGPKAGRGKPESRETIMSTLDVWDAHLARAGAELLVAREHLVSALRPHVEHAYAAVAGDGGPATVGYRRSFGTAATARSERPESAAEGGGTAGNGEDRSSAPSGGRPPAPPDTSSAPSGGRPPAPPDTSSAPSGGRPPAPPDTTGGGHASRVRAAADELREALAEVRDSELDRGVCLAGPHRDELGLTVRGLPARGYASHGESWSLALALRLASFELLRAGRDDPVLILDDVFAELDTGRRDRLAALVAEAEQVLVTAAVPADVPPVLAGTRFTVSAGGIDRAG